MSSLKEQLKNKIPVVQEEIKNQSLNHEKVRLGRESSPTCIPRTPVPTRTLTLIPQVHAK